VNLAARYEVDLSRLRLPGVALLVGGVLFAHLPETWGVPCPLRALTGVPCPFCGLTTAVRDTCGGHVDAAASAAPLGFVVLLMAVLGIFNVGPRRLHVPMLVIWVGLAAEWIFELHRFHLLA
jgi:hypothetical protein